MNNPSILFTCRFDVSSPISTIHHEVSKRASNYHITAFGSENISSIDDTIIISAPIKKRDIPRLLLAYVNDYDIIHTGPRRRDNLARLTTLRGAKRVHTLHATPTQPDVIKRERASIAHANHVTAVSEFVKQWAIEELKVDKQISVIPNGVDLTRFTPSNNSSERTFIYVGRLVRSKHPEQIVRLAQNRPNATFKICGSGPKEDEIINSAQALPNLKHIPKLPHEELADLYAEATAVLCPHEREGFGMVVIEALASGTPVVGLNSGNLPSLINEGENGILCDSLEIDKWLAALERVQVNQDNYSPRDTVKKYSWDNISQHYISLYNRII